MLPEVKVVDLLGVKRDGASMADMLNKELQELQVNEMARLIKLPIENWLEDTGAIPQATTYYAELMSCVNDSAEVIFNENYRKINENEVVISKEEWESLVTRPNLHTAIDVFAVRKETAEKIFKELFKRAERQTNFDCRMALDLDNLAKEFGVKIKGGRK